MLMLKKPIAAVINISKCHILMACTNSQVLEIREHFKNILCEMSDIYKNSDIS